MVRAEAQVAEQKGSSPRAGLQGAVFLKSYEVWRTESCVLQFQVPS